jgi:hypothetical protein
MISHSLVMAELTPHLCPLPFEQGERRNSRRRVAPDCQLQRLERFGRSTLVVSLLLPAPLDRYSTPPRS